MTKTKKEKGSDSKAVTPKDKTKRPRIKKPKKEKTGEGKAKVKNVLKDIKTIIAKVALQLIIKRISLMRSRLDEKILEVKDPELNELLDNTADLFEAFTASKINAWLDTQGDDCSGAILIGCNTPTPSLLLVQKGTVGRKNERVWLDRGTLDTEGFGELLIKNENK
jgi:hypothetical protein